MAARGVGNTALRESAPRSGACDWPRVAMVAGAAFTRIHCSSYGGGGAGGRGGVLVVHIVHLCSGSCLQVSRWRRRRAKNRCVVHVCAISLHHLRDLH